MLLHAVLAEDRSQMLSGDLRTRIRKYLEERRNDGPVTSEAAKAFASAIYESLVVADAFIPDPKGVMTPARIDKYVAENPPRTREQAIREVNAPPSPATRILGFVGLVQCPRCKGAGQLGEDDGGTLNSKYSCPLCFDSEQGVGTGNVTKRFTLEELHTALNEISLKHARR